MPALASFSLPVFCSTALGRGFHVTTLAPLALSACVVTASSDVERSLKALPLWQPFLAFPWSAVPHASDEVLSGSPSAPTPASDLLRFWEEDPIEGGDRIPKQFWGDIFAKLPHTVNGALDRPAPTGLILGKFSAR